MLRAPFFVSLAACTEAPIDVTPPRLDRAVADSPAPPDSGETAEPIHTGESSETGDSGTPAPWNIVVVMTDDQRADSLWAMPTVTAELVEKGVTFANAHTSSPLCCPSRAGFLSGGYRSSVTGVLNNNEPNGGYAHFDDTMGLGPQLFAAGWYTALIGKYMNQYAADDRAYVPPGWSHWEATGTLRHYVDWDVVLGASGASASEGVLTPQTRYETDAVFASAAAVAETAPEPFFLLVTPSAPHDPFEYDAAYLGMFDDYQYRGGAYDEADVSDKPNWLQAVAPLSDTLSVTIDENAQAQLRMLQSVDAGVATLLAALDARGLLDRTLIVFTSDNGYLYGEHRLTGKSVPYLPSVSVPLVMRAPGVAPGSVTGVVSSNLDLAATVLDVAGLPPKTEGFSLLDVLTSSATPDPGPRILEGLDRAPVPWVAYDSDRWRMTLWEDDQVELYDVVADPDEASNLADFPPGDAPYAAWLAALTAARPLVQSWVVPAPLFVNEPASLALEHTGGVAPFAWTIGTGALPTGLSLDTATGVISGTPTAEGDFTARITLQDSSASPYDGSPATYAADYSFTVGEEAEVRARARLEPDAKGYAIRATLPHPMDVVLRWGDDLSFDAAANHVERKGFQTGTIRLDGVRPGRRLVWELSAHGRVLARGTTVR